MEVVADAYAAFMVPSVFREITVAGQSGAAWFSRAMIEGKVKLLPLDGDAPAVGSLGRLDAGERDTMVAYGRGAMRFIIIDDRKGVQFCRTMAIPHINALLCPKILYWSGWINRQRYCSALGFLLQTGRYSTYVTDYARRCTAAQLTAFYP